MNQQINISIGLCACGCGQITKIAPQTRARSGQIQGQPFRFIHGHNNRNVIREKSSQWKGGRKLAEGYVLIKQSGHARANNQGYVFEHILVVERALGKPLPPKAEVHHVNGNGSDNRGANLVVCQNSAYHQLLHVRLRALKACGNPNFRKCQYCHIYTDPSSLISPKTQPHHRKCRNEYLYHWRLRAKQSRSLVSATGTGGKS